MVDKPENPQAFATPSTWLPNHEQLHYGHDGMTLRDYFAGQALIGLLSAGANLRPELKICATSYDIADKMLGARGE